MTREAIILNIREPLSLLLAAWRWLAAEADDLAEKRRCIEAILRLDPGNEQAQHGLAVGAARAAATTGNNQ